MILKKQSIHKIFAYLTFGWIVLSGGLHFVIDVISQFIRNTRIPGYETTLYYGLHTSYALCLLLFGLLGLIIAHHTIALLDHWSFILLTALATVAWLVIDYAFIEYQEPGIMISICGAFFLAFIFTR